MRAELDAATVATAREAKEREEERNGHAAELVALRSDADERLRIATEMSAERERALAAELDEERRKLNLVRGAVGERLSLASAAVEDALGLGDALATELVCPNCLGDLVEPQLLTPCGHSFCGACVDQLRTRTPRGEIACPTCLEEGTLASSAVVAFPNYAVEAIYTRISAKRLEASKLRNVLRRQKNDVDVLVGIGQAPDDSRASGPPPGT